MCLIKRAGAQVVALSCDELLLPNYIEFVEHSDGGILLNFTTFFSRLIVYFINLQSIRLHARLNSVSIAAKMLPRGLPRGLHVQLFIIKATEEPFCRKIIPIIPFAAYFKYQYSTISEPVKCF